MIQEIVLITTIVLMLVVVGAFVYVVLHSTKQSPEYDVVQKASYGIRVKFFWCLSLAAGVITVITTLDLPYAANRGEIPNNAVEVNVEGRQWAWVMDSNQAALGDTVVFNVSASDVTHGLGVYNPDMQLIAQTQAMPFGYVNKLKITFDKPGTYKLLCMEYCGLAHHAMISDFVVSDKAGVTE